MNKIRRSSAVVLLVLLIVVSALYVSPALAAEDRAAGEHSHDSIVHGEPQEARQSIYPWSAMHKSMKTEKLKDACESNHPLAQSI